MTEKGRISIPTADEIPASSQGMLEAANKMMGFVPNVLKVLSKSPDALGAFLTLQNNLAKTLDLKTRTAISLAVSETNGCHYCLSAHSFFANKAANISDSEISLNREGKSEDKKVEAAATFASEIVRRRGRVSNEAFEKVRAAGYSDKEIVDIIALSTQFTFTNLVNSAAGTDIDFDPVPLPKNMM